MIRPSTIASMLLCGTLGFSLYRVAYEVTLLESELGQINRQILADQEEKHVLSAELSFLTQPSRIGQLAGRHLDLKPLTTAQIGSFDTLPLKEEAPAAAVMAKDTPVDKILAAMQLAENIATPERGRKIASGKPETFQ